MKKVYEFYRIMTVILLLIPLALFSQNQRQHTKYFETSNGVKGYVELTTQPVNYSGPYIMVRQDKVVITSVKTEKGFYHSNSTDFRNSTNYSLPIECNNCFFYANGTVQMYLVGIGSYYGKFNTSSTVNSGGNLGAASHNVIFDSKYALIDAERQRKSTGVDPWSTNGMVDDIEISQVKGQGINELLRAIRIYEQEKTKNNNSNSSSSKSEKQNKQSEKSDSQVDTNSTYYKTVERNSKIRDEVDALLKSGNYARANQIMDSNPNLFSSQERLNASVGEATGVAVAGMVALGDNADSGYISFNYYSAQYVLVGADLAMKFNIEDSPVSMGFMLGYAGTALGNLFNKDQGHTLNQFEIGDEEFRPNDEKGKYNVFKLGWVFGLNDDKFRIFNEITPFASYTLMSNYQVCVSGCDDDDDFTTVKGGGFNYGFEIRLIRFLKFGILFQDSLDLVNSNEEDFFVGPDEDGVFRKMEFRILSPFQDLTFIYGGIVIPL